MKHSHNPYFVKLVVFVFAWMAVGGCILEDGDLLLLQSNGLTRDINRLVPMSIIDTMERMNLPIFRGGSPPNIEGAYLISPFILFDSSIEDDPPGHRFADYRVRFFGQSNDRLRLHVDFEHGEANGYGVLSFIVGTGSRFTVFSVVNTTRDGETAQVVHVFSGRSVPDGIQDLFFANFMLDNGGNPNDTWIHVGDGRVVYDADGFSEKTPDF